LFGVWSPTLQIFYDEIRALYRYRVRDWGYLVVGLLYAVVGGLVLLFAEAAGQASLPTLLLSLSMLGALIIALCAFRIFVVQRSMVRLDTVTGPFKFATAREEVVAALASRVVAAPAASGEGDAPTPPGDSDEANGSPDGGS